MDLGNAKFVDSRIEESAAETTKEQAVFVAKADESLAALLKAVPPGRTDCFGYHRQPPEISELQGAICRASNLAWALRRFPVFDPSCMRMMRKEKGLKVFLKPQWGTDQTFELDLWVPIFGMTFLPGEGEIAKQTWQPGYANYINISLDEALIRENQRELEVKKANGITLETKCPPVPAAITRGVNKVNDKFERTWIVWEAQWSAYAEVKDPLILGQIGNIFFLLDQFDATKLERYVTSEFCKRPQQ